MIRLSAVFICIATLSLLGCGAVIQRTDKGSEENFALVSELVHRNESLKSFKGIGEATLRKEGRSYFGRLAWAGSDPDKLRVEILGAPGQPKVGFSSDGARVYYFDSNGKGSTVKQISAKNPDLERFIAVSITSSEVVSFLAGRLPNYSPQRVRMSVDPNGDGYIVALNPRWWQTDRQEIFLDSKKRDIRKIENYSGTDLSYRVEFPKMQTLEGYRVPSEMRISDADGNYFMLRIDRYWANATTSPDLFRLETPQDAERKPFSGERGSGSTP
ncbi:MAG: hypothetical protein C4530_21730 [Desulfobacteraceae bacterium]|nr:MAG: hypothetical protein C4530_21730 [Desulfobacteraceae bacterium]